MVTIRQNIFHQIFEESVSVKIPPVKILRHMVSENGCGIHTHTQHIYASMCALVLAHTHIHTQIHAQSKKGMCIHGYTTLCMHVI